MTTTTTTAVAVYCASSLGTQKAYQSAARSVGIALAEADRRLVYGGGSRGIMGVVSGAVLEHGGRVTGVIPLPMVAAGGEGKQGEASAHVHLDKKGSESLETIVVSSMHDRKVEMAQRSCGFVGLPGGFGTFEEVLEVTTWTQIGLHIKPVILANVLSYFDPLRQLIQNGVKEGFIRPHNAPLITFVDGPADHSEHESFDWGKAVLEALDNWNPNEVVPLGYVWTNGTNGVKQNGGGLEAS